MFLQNFSSKVEEGNSRLAASPSSENEHAQRRWFSGILGIEHPLVLVRFQVSDPRDEEQEGPNLVSESTCRGAHGWE